MSFAETKIFKNARTRLAALRGISEEVLSREVGRSGKAYLTRAEALQYMMSARPRDEEAERTLKVFFALRRAVTHEVTANDTVQVRR